MSDKLTAQLQKMEREYDDLKKYFAADGKVTSDEELILKEVRTKIDVLKQKAQARVSVESSKKTTTKNGHEAGAVVGLHANVSCEVGDPVGDPKRYPVTLTVSFGASAKLSGTAKSKASVGVELKGSVERTMVQTHQLGEAELGIYVEALRAASKGSRVAAKQSEFAIIALGVNQGWDAARLLWEGGGNAISAKTGDSLKNQGDSIQVTDNRTGGANVNAKAGGVGIGAGSKDSHEKSTKVTRNDTGGLDVDANTAHTNETNLSGSLNAGVVGLDIGSTHTKKTSFGYSITVDPKKDPDGKILEWLASCTTQQDYQVFIAANTGKIRVTGQTTGNATADGTSIGVSIAGVKANIGTNQGVRDETVRDGSGRLVKKTVVGEAGAGGKALSHSDSVKEEAVAEIDGKGKASVTLTRTKTDGDTVDKSGLGLSNNDLKRLGASAVRSLDYWMSGVRRADEREDWRAAGKAIASAKGAPAVVAEQLARFVGGDRVERLKTVQKFVGSMGRRFEFPESMKRLQQSYEIVTAEALPDELNKLAATNPAAAVEKCKSLLKILDLLDPQIRNNTDFENNATKMEMLQRMTRRRQLLAEAAKGFGGQRKPEDDPALLQQAADRLQKQLSSFSVEQARVGAKLHELLDGQPKFLARDLGDAKGLIRQLDDMHKRWWADYRSMKETMSKRGVANWEMPLLKPDDALLGRYEKAAGLK